MCFYFYFGVIKEKKNRMIQCWGIGDFMWVVVYYFFKTVDRYISWTMACYDLFDIVKSGR